MNITLSNMWGDGINVLGSLVSKGRTGVLILLGCMFIILIIKIAVDLLK